MANESYNAVMFNTNFKPPEYLKNKEDKELDQIYSRLKGRVNEVISNKLNKPIPFKFTTYDNIPSKYNVDELTHKLDTVNNAIKTNGAFYGFDIETLGDIGENATDLDKSLFTVTELSLLKRNKNGTDEVMDSIQLGINIKKKTMLDNLVNRLSKNEPINNFTEAEKSTFERLSRYSGHFRNRFKLGDNELYHVTELAESDWTNVSKIRQGIDNLYTLARYGQEYGARKDKVKTLMSNFAKHLSEATSENNILLGYNSINFDMPRIQHMLDQHGIKSNIDFNHHVDVAQLFNSAFYGEIPEFYNKVSAATGTSVPKKEIGRLQTIAKTYNANLKAHLADADTSFTMDFFLGNVPGYNTPMHELMYKKLHERIKDGNRVSITDANKSSVVLFANRGIRKNPMDIILDNTGKEKTYMSIGPKRRHSYNVDEVSYISYNDFIDGKNDIKALVQAQKIKTNSNASGLYIVKLSDASTNIKNKESMYIIRDNLNDIQSLIQNDLSGYFMASDTQHLDGRSINKKIINNTTIDAIKDNARRSLSSMKEVNNNKGFAYAEKMYGAFESVNSAYAKALQSIGIETPSIMSNEDANSLIMNGILNINNNGKTAKITIDDIGSVAKNIDTLQNFQYLYKDMSNNHRVMKHIINNINEKITNTALKTSVEKIYSTQYLNTKKTVALQNIISSINDNVINKIQSNKSFNGSVDEIFNALTVKTKQFGDISSIMVNIGDESTRISAHSANSAFYGFLNIANKITKEDKSSTLREQKKVGILKNIAEDYYNRGILSNEVIKSISNIEDSTHIARVLGTNVNEMITNLTSAIGNDNINNLNDVEMGLIRRIYENTFNQLNEQNINGELGRGNEFKNYYIQKTIENIHNDPTFKTIEQYKELTGNIETHDNSLIYNGKTIDEYVDKFFNTNDLNNIIDNGINNIYNIDFADFNGRESYANKDFNKKADDLLRRHGYSEENIKTFHDVMSNKNHGLLNKDKNLSVALYETRGDNSKLKIAITHKDNSLKLYQDLAKGITPEKASIIDLPEVSNEIEGMKYVQVGAMRKAVTQKLDVYPAARGQDSLFNLKTTLNDTVDESLKGLKIMHNFITENINSGIYERTRSAVQRAVNKPVMSDKGYSGFESIVDESGNIIKTNVPNINDFHANKLVDSSALINYIPYLYETLDKKDPIIQDINLLWSTEKVNARWYMQKWIEKLSMPKTSVKTLEELSGDQRQWFINNLVTGKNLIQKIIDNSDRIKNKDFIAPLRFIANQHPSQLIEEQNVAAGFISLINPYNSVPFSYMNPFSRPTVNQLLSLHTLNLNNKNTDGYFTRFHKTIKNKERIKIGSSIVTNSYSSYIDAMHNSGIDIEYGITGNVKMMNTSQVLDRIDYIRNVLNDEKTYNKMFGKIMANHPEYTKQDIINILDKAELKSSTWQQHSILNPFITNRVFKSHEVKTYPIGDLDSFVFGNTVNENGESIPIGIGSYINKGDTIGYVTINGEQKPIFNRSGKAKITGYANGRLQVQPIVPEIDEIKTNIMGGEKTVASAFDRNPDIQDLAQTMWDNMFGRDIAQVSNLEMAKHENGSLIYGSNLYKIADIAESKGQNEIDYFLNVMNKPESVKGLTKEQIKHLQSLKQMQFSYFTDVHGVGRFNTAEDPGKGNFYTGIDELVNIFSNRDNDYAKALNDDSVIRGLISRVQMTEAHSANDGETDLNSKGVKINARSNQVIGTEHGFGHAEAFNDYVDGHYVKKMDTYLNTIKDRLSKHQAGKITEASKAEEDLGNIGHAVRHALDIDTNDIIGAFDFKDLNIPISGVTANELTDTIFETLATNEAGQRINTYAIKLPEGLTYTNPFTKQQSNIIHLAHLNNHTVDGYAYLTGSQKAEADVLSSIAKLQDKNDDKKGLSELVDEMNKSIKNMYSAFDDEIHLKQGMLQKHLNTFRLPYSGYGLSNVSYSPVFAQDNSELVNRIANLDEEEVKKNGLGAGYEGLRFRNRFNQDALKIVDGKPLFYDVVHTSKEQLEDMGVNFTKIGKQIYTEKYRNNINFKQSLIDSNIISKEGNPLLKNIDLPHDKILLDMLNQTDKQNRKEASDFLKNVIETYRTKGSLELLNISGLNDINKYILKTYTNELNKFYEQVGTEWIRKVGIMGTVGRPPYFHDTSFRVANIRLTDLDHKVFAIQAHTLMALNDDHDGDNIGVSLNLVDGQLDAVNSKAEQTLREVYEAQAKYTNGYLAYQAIKDYNKTNDNYKNTRKGYREVLAEKRPEAIEQANHIYLNGVIDDANNTRQFKNNIGGISTPNLFVRNAADEVFTNSLENMNTHRARIYDFTKLTEQQLIDTKHMQDIMSNANVRPTPTFYYLNGLQMMSDAKTPEDMQLGLSNVTKALNMAQINKEEYPDLNNQLQSLVALFNNKKAKSIYNNPLGINRPTFTDSKIEDLKNVITNPEQFSDSPITRNVVSLINNSINSVSQDISLNNIANSNNTYMYKRNGNIYTYNETSIGKKTNIQYMRFVNTNNSSDVINIYGSNTKELLNNVNSNYYNITSSKLNSNDLNNYSAITKLRNNNIISDAQGGELVRQFNEDIKRRGANPSNTSQIMFDYLTKNKIVNVNNISGMNRYINNLDNRTTQTINSADINELIQKVNNTKIYDEDDALTRLRNNLQSQINDSNSQQLRNSNIANSVNNQMIEEPMNNIRNTNTVARDNISNYIQQIANTNTKESNAYMNWQDINNSLNNEEILNSLQNSKIGYGKYANQKIGDLDINTLNNIYNSSNKSSNAIQETKRRIQMYFSTLDTNDLGDDIVRDINANNIKLSNSTIEDNVISDIKSLNDAIKEAGAEAQPFDKHLNEQSSLFDRLFTKADGSRNIKAMLLGGTALLVAGSIISHQFTAKPNTLRPENQNNGSGSPSPDGSYDDIQLQAPSTPKSIRVADNRNTGVKYQISGNVDNSFNHDNMVNAINNVIDPRGGHVSINTTSKNKDVDQNWLQNQVSKAIT